MFWIPHRRLRLWYAAWRQDPIICFIAEWKLARSVVLSAVEVVTRDPYKTSASSSTELLSLDPFIIIPDNSNTTNRVRRSPQSGEFPLGM